MTKDMKTIDLTLLPVETLGEMANEAAEQVEKNAKATVQKAIDCGRYLTAIKDQLEHGQWGGWLGANWNYSQKTATQYMQISNFTSGLNLTDASSISEALRIISDSKPETVPRSQRKPADVVVSIPHETNEINETEVDDDPTPDPPTQRKTAKGSEKVSEDKKPRTQQILPEILPDEPEESLPEERTLSDWSVAEILSFLKASADDPKKRAKELRKVADELDPPKKFMPPDIDDVRAYCIERKNKVDPEAFHAHYSANGWKQANGNKLADWKAAVITWEKRDDSGNRNGTGHTRVTTARAKTAPVDESKIRYV